MKNHHLFAAALLSVIAAPALAAESAAPAPQGQATFAAATSSVAQGADDAATTAKVKAALLADKEISALNVHVTTEQGVVLLEGAVDRPELADRAAKIAASVSGVKGIENQLKAAQIN